MRDHAAKLYLQMSIQAASKEQVLLTLYDTAIIEARMAAIAIRNDDLDGRSEHIHRVSSTISELISALDHTAAPELCMQLLQLYLYMKRRLANADANLEAEAAEEVTGLLDDLRAAWRQAVAEIKNEGQPAPSVT